MSLINLLAISCAHAEGMCSAQEAAIFNCELQKSVASLCEARDTGVLSYRNGAAIKSTLKFRTMALAREGSFISRISPMQVAVRHIFGFRGQSMLAISTIKLSRQRTVQRFPLASLYMREKEKFRTLYAATMPRYMKICPMTLPKRVIEA